MMEWSEWKPFPDPNLRGYIYAPFGPGVYELRNKERDEYVLFGRSKNVAWRMTSLFSRDDGGQGNRNNKDKQQYVQENLTVIEYRTLACDTEENAKKQERQLKSSRSYVFPT